MRLNNFEWKLVISKFVKLGILIPGRMVATPQFLAHCKAREAVTAAAIYDILHLYNGNPDIDDTLVNVYIDLIRSFCGEKLADENDATVELLAIGASCFLAGTNMGFLETWERGTRVR